MFVAFWEYVVACLYDHTTMAGASGGRVTDPLCPRVRCPLLSGCLIIASQTPGIVERGKGACWKLGGFEVYLVCIEIAHGGDSDTLACHGTLEF